MDWVTLVAVMLPSVGSGGLLAVILANQLGLLQLRHQQVMGQHQIEMDRWRVFEQTLKDDIALAEEMKEKDRAADLRKQLAEVRESWRRGGMKQVAEWMKSRQG